ncbi:MAG: AAA family ATPase [Desulfuromonadales bacterium]|nr:AAA family ATPase [Desulfuromonadales bacterium]
MCKKIFIGATAQHCGKTTISLSLMHLALKKYPRVGFIKPIGPKCIEYRGICMDVDAAMVSSVFNLDDDVRLMSPMALVPGSTRRFLDGEIPADYPRRTILEAVEKLEQKNDLLIIEGAGHTGVGSVFGVDNATVAAMLGAPVLLVTGCGIGSVIDEVKLNLALYREAKAKVDFIMLNKMVPDKKERSLHYIRKVFEKDGITVTTAFDFLPILADPTLQHIAELLKLPLMGDQRELSRICHTIQLGVASCQRVIDILGESTLLVVNSSRDELLVTASSLHHIPDFKKRLTGLVICGQSPISAITQQILEDSNIPYFRVKDISAEVFIRLREHVSKIGPDDREKIELINATAERCIDFDAIDAKL